MQLQPVGDHIIVKPLDVEKVTLSGIIIPETVEAERSERGEVVAVGPGKLQKCGLRQTPEVAVGDKIIFKKYAPDEVEVGGAKFLIIRSEDVMAIIK
ncbi:MAG: co-chaperone GroES [Patescibacteria group bacterium]|jgi:chaperonin GroES